LFFTRGSSSFNLTPWKSGATSSSDGLMPVMFLFILNSYSSGLSYYYFLANLITIGQTYLIRYFVDEDKIRMQLLANKKKPVNKSNFQKRLEDMAKQRGTQLPKK